MGYSSQPSELASLLLLVDHWGPLDNTVSVNILWTFMYCLIFETIYLCKSLANIWVICAIIFFPETLFLMCQECLFSCSLFALRLFFYDMENNVLNSFLKKLKPVIQTRGT